MNWALRALALTSLVLLQSAFGDAAEMPPGGGGVRVPGAPPPEHTIVIHLPGIAGDRWVDKQMTSGLRDAGYAGALETYDWTEHDPGLNALRALKRNQAEAAKIADLIVYKIHADPSAHIILTGHSGGTGLAVWALEKLPADVKIDTLLLLSSALSPDYDLSKALSHIRGNCYSFFSENDVLVLAAGTKLFGTIDGKYTESAGEFGFVLPPTADAAQYAKLIQKPYDRSWMQYGNIGDHIGPMHRSFSEHVLAPLLFGHLESPRAQSETELRNNRS